MLINKLLSTFREKVAILL